MSAIVADHNLAAPAMPATALPTAATTDRGLLIKLAVLLLATVTFRAVAIERPLVGHFATKNVVYAMIARNWVRGEASFFRPTIDVLVNGQKGWHLLEVPLSAYVAGAGWHYLGGSLDAWGRAISIACSAVSVLLMFVLMKRWHGETAAWGASVALALSPVSVIYGQMFMLEPSVVMLTLLTFWTAYRFLDDPRWWKGAATCVAFFTLTQTKIYMGAAVAPFLAWPMLSGMRRNLPRPCAHLMLWCLVALAFNAFMIRDFWQPLKDGPDQDRIFYSLGESSAVHSYTTRWLLTPQFYRHLLDSLVGIVLTPIGFCLALLGLTTRQWWRHTAWIAGSMMLVNAMPRKFYEMSYYHLVTLPVLCVLVGLGWDRLQRGLKLNHFAVAGVVMVAVVFSARYSLTPAFSIPTEDRSVVAAAEAAKVITPTDESIATLHGSTLDLLYYCDRAGFALDAGSEELAKDIDDARQRGAKRLVVANLDQLQRENVRAALKDLPTIAEGNDYRIYELSNVGDE